MRPRCARYSHVYLRPLAEEAKLEKEKVYEVRNKELASQMEVLMTQKLENERCASLPHADLPLHQSQRQLGASRVLPP